MAIAQAWVEKYRPKSVADVIMTNEHHQANFTRYVEKGEIPNLILIGGPGTGKSTISRALCRDLKVHRSDITTINCSDEKIDAIREVSIFANTMPMGKFKIVRLEEFDGIGIDAQRLLRSMMEDCSDTVRFIVTANHRNKIMPEMFSRLQEYAFVAPNLDILTDRCMDILETEGIKYDADTLGDIIALAYPDFRKVIHLLEQSSGTGTLILDKTSEVIASWKFELLPLIDAGDWSGARRIVCASAAKEDMPEMFRFLYQNLSRCENIRQFEDEALVLIARYQYQYAFVSDPEIQAAALFIELSRLK